MAAAKQKDAARKNIKKAQTAWNNVSSRGRTRVQTQGQARTNKRSPSLALRRILVPLDFSGQSRQALEVAIPLADHQPRKETHHAAQIHR